jgi:hypothetical protein
LHPAYNERLDLLLTDPLDVAQADANRAVGLDIALRPACIDVGRPYFNRPPLSFVHERVRGVEAHRLLVE